MTDFTAILSMLKFGDLSIKDANEMINVKAERLANVPTRQQVLQEPAISDAAEKKISIGEILSRDPIENNLGIDLPKDVNTSSNKPPFHYE